MGLLGIYVHMYTFIQNEVRTLIYAVMLLGKYETELLNRPECMGLVSIRRYNRVLESVYECEHI